jgi:hypothetical protein
MADERVNVYERRGKFNKILAKKKFLSITKRAVVLTLKPTGTP